MIRSARAGEAAAILDVVHQAYRHYIPRIGKPPGPMLDEYDPHIAAGNAWVLDEAGLIAGALILVEQPDGFLLDNIAVRPDQQGKGYGRELLQFSEAEARRCGFAEIRLYTHALMTENIDLYQRVGYRETHRVSEKGYDRVYMVKPLD